MEKAVKFSIRSYIFNLSTVGIIAAELLLTILLNLIFPTTHGENGIYLLSAIILAFGVIPLAGIFQCISAIYALLSRRFVTMSLLVFPLLIIADFLGVFDNLVYKLFHILGIFTDEMWRISLFLLFYAISSSVCLTIDIKKHKSAPLTSDPITKSSHNSSQSK